MYITIPACLFLFMASISNPKNASVKIRKSLKPKNERKVELKENLIDKDSENFPEQ